MKKCFQCNQLYDDNDLNFCLSDGTPLVSASDSTSETTMIISSPLTQQSVGSVRSGVNLWFVLVPIGLLALVVGGMALLWLKSNSSPPASIIKGEPQPAISNSNEPKSNPEPKQLAKQKESLAQVQQPIEQEREKPADERKKLEPKKNDPLVVSPTPTTKSVSGTWFVVLGSFPKNERSKADERLQALRNSGFEASIVDTNNYPGFRSGLWSVVMGPYSKSEAGSRLTQMKSVRADAYIKSGW